MATSGFGPASAMARLKATGSLSMRMTPSSSPASFSRTINDRRRCRSMATYCRSKGLLFLLERVGFVAWATDRNIPTAGAGTDIWGAPPCVGRSSDAIRDSGAPKLMAS